MHTQYIPDLSYRIISALKSRGLASMIGENRQLVTKEQVELEKQPVEVQDCRKITDHSRGIYSIHPTFIKENRRMSTCNRLDLQTLGSQLVLMLKNLPDHCLAFLVTRFV